MSTHLSSRLPSNPNLEHLKKQAKQLVKDHTSGQVDAFSRIKASFPRLSSASVQEILNAEFTLCNAQLVIAREYGFTTWQKLADAVTTLESNADTFITTSPSLQWIQDQLTNAAATDLPTLITGESGTGKAVAARAIHQQSDRKSNPFIQVACTQDPETLVQSELFGHEVGAFTGANAPRVGKLEFSRGGTLFLDEICDLSLAAQAKLLKLLEDGTFERLGGTQAIQPNVRIIGATNRDLGQMVEAGTFRQDLAFILQKHHIHLPSLRDRKDDIPTMATHFMREMATHLNKEIPQLSSEAQTALQSHDWPGNARELEHRIQRAVVECSDSTIQKADVVL